MKHHLHTEVDIDAPLQIVWDVLTDLEAYPDWNPFIVSAEGDVVVGERLTNRMQPPGSKAMTFRPVVTVVETAKTLEWLGRLGMPGIFDGRHRFELHSLSPGRTRLTHAENLNGLLVRPLRKSLDTKTKQGFEAMNLCLKRRAEAAAQSDRTTPEPRNASCS